MIGHVAPEAAVGGPLAAVQEGDTVIIDIPNRRLDVEVDADAIGQRLAQWSAPQSIYTSGVLAKYRAFVQQASEGAITRVE